MLNGIIVNDEAKNYRNEPEVIVHYDYVVVCGIDVPRPSGISPSQWLDYWNRRLP